jgi:hypothetical protein
MRIPEVIKPAWDNDNEKGDPLPGRPSYLCFEV